MLIHHVGIRALGAVGPGLAAGTTLLMAIFLTDVLVSELILDTLTIAMRNIVIRKTLTILKVIALSAATAVVGEDTTRAFGWTVVEHFKGGFPRFYDIVLPFIIHLHLANSLIKIYLL